MTDEKDLPKKENRVKAHLAKHKTAYLVTGAVVITAAVTAVVTRSIDTNTSIPEVFAQAKNQAVFQWKPKAEVTVKLIRRGHPGFHILCNETGEEFASIRRAAEVYGVNPIDISKQLRGIVDRVGEYTFTNLGEM